MPEGVMVVKFLGLVWQKKGAVGREILEKLRNGAPYVNV